MTTDKELLLAQVEEILHSYNDAHRYTVDRLLGALSPRHLPHSLKDAWYLAKELNPSVEVTEESLPQILGWKKLDSQDDSIISWVLPNGNTSTSFPTVDHISYWLYDQHNLMWEHIYLDNHKVELTAYMCQDNEQQCVYVDDSIRSALLQVIDTVVNSPERFIQ